jgi:hypothetical protein
MSGGDLNLIPLGSVGETATPVSPIVGAHAGRAEADVGKKPRKRAAEEAAADENELTVGEETRHVLDSLA